MHEKGVSCVLLWCSMQWPHIVERQGNFLEPLLQGHAFIVCLIHEAPPSWTNHLPKALPLNTIPLGVRMSTCEFWGETFSHSLSIAMESAQDCWSLITLMELTAKVCSLMVSGLSSLSVVKYHGLICWPNPPCSCLWWSGGDAHLVPGLGDHPSDWHRFILTPAQWPICEFIVQHYLLSLVSFYRAGRNSRILRLFSPRTQKSRGLDSEMFSDSGSHTQTWIRTRLCGFHFPFILFNHIPNSRKKHRAVGGTWSWWKTVGKNGHYYSSSCSFAIWLWSPSHHEVSSLSLSFETCPCDFLWQKKKCSKKKKKWCCDISDSRSRKVLHASVLFLEALSPPYEQAQLSYWRSEDGRK